MRHVYRLREDRAETEVDAPIDHLPREVAVSRRRVITVLTVAAAVMLLGNVVGHIAASAELAGDAMLIRLADLDGENTVPTWFSTSLLLASAILFWVIGRYEATDGGHWPRHWTGLSLLFLGLSIDEAASFHEALSYPIRESLELDGFLYYAWVIPASVAVVIVAGIYARFVVWLPPGIRWRVVAAGALFVGGALGMEMVGSGLSRSAATTGYVIAVTIEEALEIGAVILLIDALLRYLSSFHETVAFRLQPESEQ